MFLILPFMKIYHFIALWKIVLWWWVLLTMYLLINPKLDPVLAYTGFFAGLLLMVWWVSFYLFLGVHSLWKQHYTTDLALTSYKLSLLLWLFVVLNWVLFLLRQRSRELWFVLLVLFVGLFALLYKQEFYGQQHWTQEW